MPETLFLISAHRVNPSHTARGVQSGWTFRRSAWRGVGERGRAAARCAGPADTGPWV